MDKRLFLIIFAVLGIVVGIVSSRLLNQFLIFFLLIATYLIVFAPIYFKHKKEKEVNALILETFLNYLLMWIVVFFLLSNI